MTSVYVGEGVSEIKTVQLPIGKKHILIVEFETEEERARSQNRLDLLNDRLQDMFNRPGSDVVVISTVKGTLEMRVISVEDQESSNEDSNAVSEPTVLRD